MPANFLALNGTNQSDVSSTTLTIATTRAIDVGEHVVVCEANAIGGSDPSTVTVGALGLTKRLSDTSTRDISLWSARATSALASGTTVTLTWGVAPGTRMAACLSLDGVDSASPIAGSDANVFGSGTAYNAGPTASVAAGCVMVGTTHVGAVNPINNIGGYTERAELSSGGAGTAFQVQTLDNGSAGTQTTNWVGTGASSSAGCVVVAFSPATTGFPAVPVRPMLSFRRFFSPLRSPTWPFPVPSIDFPVVAAAADQAPKPIIAMQAVNRSNVY